MIELKPFEKTDWYGFAGAESFANGDEPMIGYNGEEGRIQVIADRTGIEITLYSATQLGGIDAIWRLIVKGEWTPSDAIAFCANIEPVENFETFLKVVGFVKLN